MFTPYPGSVILAKTFTYYFLRLSVMIQRPVMGEIVESVNVFLRLKKVLKTNLNSPVPAGIILESVIAGSVIELFII